MINKTNKKYNKNRVKRKTQRHLNKKRIPKHHIKNKRKNKLLNKKLRLKQSNHTFKSSNRTSNNKTYKNHLYQEGSGPFDLFKPKPKSGTAFSSLSSSDDRNSVEQLFMNYNTLLNNLNKNKSQIENNPNELIKYYQKIQQSLVALSSALDTQELSKSDQLKFREDIIHSINTIESSYVNLNNFYKTNKQLLDKKNIAKYESLLPDINKLLSDIKTIASKEATNLGKLQIDPSFLPNIQKYSSSIETQHGSTQDLNSQADELLASFYKFYNEIAAHSLPEWQQITNKEPKTPDESNEVIKIYDLFLDFYKKFINFIVIEKQLSKQLQRFENTDIYGGPQYKPAGLDNTIKILSNVYQIIEPFSNNINSFINDGGNIYKLFNNRAVGRNIETFINYFDKQFYPNLQLLKKLQQKANEDIAEAQKPIPTGSRTLQLFKDAKQRQGKIDTSQIQPETGPALEPGQEEAAGVFSKEQLEASDKEQALKEQRLREEMIKEGREVSKQEQQRIQGLERLKQQQQQLKPINREAVMSGPSPSGLPEPLLPEKVPIPAPVPAPIVAPESAPAVAPESAPVVAPEPVLTSQIPKKVSITSPLLSGRPPIEEFEMGEPDYGRKSARDILAPMREGISKGISKLVERKTYTPLVSQTSGLLQPLEEKPIKLIPQKPLIPAEKEGEKVRLLQPEPKEQKPSRISQALGRVRQALKPSTEPKFTTGYQQLVETGEPPAEPEPVEQESSIEKEIPMGKIVPVGQPIITRQTAIAQPAPASTPTETQELFRFRLWGIRRAFNRLRNEVGQTTLSAEKLLKDSSLEKCNYIINTYINELEQINKRLALLGQKISNPKTNDELTSSQTEKMRLDTKYRELQEKFIEDLNNCKEGQDEDNNDKELEEMRQRLQQIVSTTPEQPKELKSMLHLSTSELPEFPSEISSQQGEPSLKSVVTSVSSTPTDDGASKVTITVKVPRVFPTQMTGSISGTAAELFEQLMNQPYRNIPSGESEQTKTISVGTNGEIQTETGISQPIQEQPSLIDLPIQESAVSSQLPDVLPSTQQIVPPPPPPTQVLTTSAPPLSDLSSQLPDILPSTQQVVPPLPPPTQVLTTSTPVLSELSSQLLARPQTEAKRFEEALNERKRQLQQASQQVQGLTSLSGELSRKQRALKRGLMSSFLSSATAAPLLPISEETTGLLKSDSDDETMSILSRAESGYSGATSLKSVPTSQESEQQSQLIRGKRGEQSVRFEQPEEQFSRRNIGSAEERPDVTVTSRGRLSRQPERFKPTGKGGSPDLEEYIIKIDDNSKQENNSYIQNLLQTINKNKNKTSSTPKKHKINKKDLKHITIKKRT